MKKMQTIIAIGTLVMGMALSGVANAGGPRDSQFRGDGRHRSHEKTELGLLTGYIKENLMTKVLSELTGQPVEVLDQRIKDRCLWALLDEYQIDRHTFKSAMRVKTVALLRQFAANGYITPEQEKDIIGQMERHAQRKALMTRLVEKGLEDGTVTQEEARMLLRKPR